jgi:hypothetical protein
LESLVAGVNAAQQKFACFSQKKVDRIFRRAALAAANARIPLAESISDNVGPKHLLNTKIVAKRAENMLLWHRLPAAIYFRRGSRSLSSKSGPKVRKSNIGPFWLVRM